MNFIYDQVVRDILSNTSQLKSTADWYARNRFSPDWTGVSHYISTGSTGIRRAAFRDHVIRLYQRKIISGLAYSANSEIDNMLAYNSSQTDMRARLRFATTEFEPYNVTNGYALYQTILERNAPLLRAAGIYHIAYQGWIKKDFWPVIVQNTDEITLHCYLPSSAMTGANMYKYLNLDSSGYYRLDAIAAAGQALGRPVKVSILFSCEDNTQPEEYAFTYFRTNPWTKPLQEFLAYYQANAAKTTQNSLIITDMALFGSKWAMKAKP